ncbi:MAG: clan AA aspartic protease [Flavobacteriaceae bacterium]|nr:clan AA aspartic protease [Flavobacteriaceae bacterium]MBT7011083.1 clan AA aspartic protease [Flavobacteriaceae bacterium]
MKQTRHSFLKSQGYTSINLKKTGTNHYQIKAILNDIEGLFILDTGASNTCADLTQTEKFKLISENSKIKASSATNLMQETKISKKNKLQVGKWNSKSCSVVLFDMNHINTALNERKIQKVDGIIGADTLKKGKAFIDYEKNRLYLKL